MRIATHNNELVQIDSKSQALVISVSLLLLLVIAVISLSIWKYSENSHDAFAINLSGRQRMLTQSIEKNLLKIKFAAQEHSEISRIQNDLKQNYLQFDQTLTMLDEGKFTDSDGNSFTVFATQSENVTDFIKQAKLIWAPLKTALLPVTANAAKLSNSSLEHALLIVSRDNHNLLRLMDSITSAIEGAAHSKSKILRIIVAIAIALILVNFIFVMFYFSRQLAFLAESRLLSMRILEHAATAIIVIKANGEIVICNHAAEDMFGYSGGTLSGENIKTILEEPYFLQIGKRQNGDSFNLDIELKQIYVSGRTLFITSLHDKTEQKLKDEQLSYLAYHDALTDLPNRMLFLDRLAQTIARAHRNSELAAVLFIDLDRFKQINDSLGHAIGDLLLQAVAIRLKNCLREGDTLARLGGDEFTMIIEANDADMCMNMTQRILSELSREFILNSHRILISGSIGASLYPINSTDISQLIHYADIAMYQAKAMGGNTCCKYPDIAPTPELL